MGSFVFAHERLVVYQKARRFCSLAVEARKRLPRGWASTGDQLHRAAFSVLLNIAEGAGRWKPGEKAQHYEIALGSAAECAAIVDALGLAWPEATRELEEARSLLAEVHAMLLALRKRFAGA